MENERGKLGKRLGDFGSEPRDLVWNAIEEKLAKKRKNRPVFWWLAAGLFLTIGIGGWFLWQTEPENMPLPLATTNSPTEKINSSSENKKIKKIDHGQSTDKETLAENNIDNQTFTDKIENATPKNVENWAIKSSENPSLINPTAAKIRKRKTATQSATLAIIPVSQKPGLYLKNETSENSSEKQHVTNESTEKNPAERENIRKQGGVLNETPQTTTEKEPIVVNSNVAQNKALDEKHAESIEPLNAAETKALPPMVELEKKGSDTLVKKPESLATEKPEILTEPSENKNNKIGSNWQFNICAGPKVAVFRDISINQNQNENPLVLETSETPVWQRVGADFGFQAAWQMQPEWNLMMTTGFTFVQENLSGLRKQRVKDSYFLQTNGNILNVNPLIINEKFELQSKQLAWFGGLGLSYSIHPGLAFQGLVASQVRFLHQESFRFGESKTNTTSSFTNSGVDLYFQLMVEKVWMVSGRKWGLKPLVQFYPKPLFNLPVGTTTKPIYTSIQLIFGW